MVAVIVICLLGSAFVAYAVTNNWGQTVNWNLNPDISFTVDESTTITVADPTQPFTQTFHIHNIGNTAIRVTGTVSFVSGSATVAWNPAVGYIDIPVSGAGQIELTLSDFSVGAGQLTVIFNSAQAP